MERPAPPRRTGTEAEVPLKLVDGLPAVELRVNGRGPFLFAIDTGQPFAISVAPGSMGMLGLTATGKMLIGDPSGNAPHPIPTFTVASLTLGNMKFSQVEGSGAAMTDIRRPNLVGTIGMSLFEGLMPTIDYGRGRFVLRPGALPAADGKQVVNMEVDSMGLIVVPITLGTVKRTVHLDTGNGRFALFVPAGDVAALPTRGVARDVGIARTIARQVSLRSIDLAVPVRVGTTRLPITAVAYPSIAPVGNLGSLGLAGTRVTIDVANRRVSILPSS